MKPAPNSRTRWFYLTLLGLSWALSPGVTQAQGQPDFSDVEIKTIQLAENFYVLEGRGGNIGVSVGEDGVFLVDDQFAPLTNKIKSAIGKISDQPIRFLLNTHYHPDHVGGNANMAASGVVIFAHDNVRKLLTTGAFNQVLNRQIPPVPDDALPIVTFSATLTFHMNGEEVHAFHVAPAHTDGDSFVHFKNADIIHTGDVFRTTSYPVVDRSANGSFDGIISGYRKLLALAGENTKIVPGHGQISTRADVAEQLDMFLTIRARVKAAIGEGKSLEQVQALKPTAEYDARWGSGRISGADITATVYQELTAN